MTSMTRLRRRLDRWTRFADRVTPGWSTPTQRGERLIRPPSGLLRAWLRHDRERLLRNLDAAASISGGPRSGHIRGT